jgi:hypothetical protein
MHLQLAPDVLRLRLDSPRRHRKAPGNGRSASPGGQPGHLELAGVAQYRILGLTPSRLTPQPAQ